MPPSDCVHLKIVESPCLTGIGNWDMLLHLLAFIELSFRMGTISSRGMAVAVKRKDAKIDVS